MPTKKQTIIFLSSNLGITLFMCYPTYSKSNFNVNEVIELFCFRDQLCNFLHAVSNKLLYQLLRF
jgi:hypothetical protein